MTTRSDEGEKLRREIGRRKSTRGRLRRDLREQCERFVAARAAAGATQKTIATELGVSAMSVQRWLRAVPARATVAMVPVRVVAPRASHEATAKLVVTTPRGLRVEGLDLDALCTILARLG